jgi:hypothetical protein
MRRPASMFRASIFQASIFQVLVLSALAATAANAEDAAVTFQLPSKTIGCVYSTYAGKNALRCDIADKSAKRARHSDCEQAWGLGFEMNANGNAARACGGDTVLDSSLPVLATGTIWQRGGFTCRLEPTKLTCSNADQHGFSLSRAEQKVF